jgi:prefoldin subunit 5
MTAEQSQAVERQNDYLKKRCAQLEGDVADLGAQVARLAQQLERLVGRPRPNPPSEVP